MYMYVCIYECMYVYSNLPVQLEADENVIHSHRKVMRNELGQPDLTDSLVHPDLTQRSHSTHTYMQPLQ